MTYYSSTVASAAEAASAMRASCSLRKPVSTSTCNAVSWTPCASSRMVSVPETVSSSSARSLPSDSVIITCSIILLQLLTIIQACRLVQCEQPVCLRLQQLLCDQAVVSVTWACDVLAEWITLPVNQAIFARYGDQLVLNVALASDETLHTLDALLGLHPCEQPCIIKHCLAPFNLS